MLLSDKVQSVTLYFHIDIFYVDKGSDEAEVALTFLFILGLLYLLFYRFVYFPVGQGRGG